MITAIMLTVRRSTRIVPSVTGLECIAGHGPRATTRAPPGAAVRIVVPPCLACVLDLPWASTKRRPPGLAATYLFVAGRWEKGYPGILTVDNPAATTPHDESVVPTAIDEFRSAVGMIV